MDRFIIDIIIDNHNRHNHKEARYKTKISFQWMQCRYST